MCGIFCYILYNQNTFLNEIAKKGCLETSNTQFTEFGTFLKSRGPDSYQELNIDISSNTIVQFAASVLWTQGNSITPQPLKDDDGNVLLWNGDIFNGSLVPAENECDSKFLSKKVKDLVKTNGNILEIFSTIRGPFSFIYYDSRHKKLYYGRDPIGRHSLLINISQRNVTLTSVCSKKLEGFEEVPAIGLFVFDLEKDGDMTHTLYPWSHVSDELIQSKTANLAISDKFRIRETLTSNIMVHTRKNEVPSDEELEMWNICSHDNSVTQLMDKLTVTDGKTRIKQTMTSLIEKPVFAENIDTLIKLLKESVRVRVEKQPKKCRICVLKMLQQIKLQQEPQSQQQPAQQSSLKAVKKPSMKKCKHTKLALLFSGGLDSAVIAFLCHNILPITDCIDLLNVAFEVPQRLSDKNLLKKKPSQTKLSKTGMRSSSDPKFEISFDVPDRLTGLQTLEELKVLCPQRKWNFVKINVTLEELKKEREDVISHLIFPLNTVLDDSLGCALWFASRGKGVLLGTDEQYTSPARIVISGLGADEQLGGYMRHRTTLKHKGGWTALETELKSEMWRISERNLGRDDRVVSSHGRQCRMPYLDEEIINFLSFLPPWERCYPVEAMPPGLGDKTLLRLAAWHLGFRGASNLPKRAMQFGSRIANSKEKGGDVSEQLKE